MREVNSHVIGHGQRRDATHRYQAVKAKTFTGRLAVILLRPSHAHFIALTIDRHRILRKCRCIGSRLNEQPKANQNKSEFA